MSGGEWAEASGEVGRGRPVSGGLWTLFSWLRRDERSASSDSLSSAGSDRTAVSFAFLAPHPQRGPTAPPPPLAPPTDSYRKRVHDGELRRKRDRNLTLLHKYGLYYGYDALSLPPARKNRNEIENEEDRDRRANSESLPRRTAHVPGKRRAPPPPSRPHSVISTASLPRRYNRKRPAPQPPVKSVEKSEENIQPSAYEKLDIVLEMNPKSHDNSRPISCAGTEGSDERKTDKYTKRGNNSKVTKIQKEKSFLKQIFENKKRNSTIEPPPERILPNISELDKQAAEIIKSRKLKQIEHNNNSYDAPKSQESWFCTKCLRRYDSTIVTCQYCLPANNNLNRNTSSSGNNKGNSSTQTDKEVEVPLSSNRVTGIGAEEKQKLKEMLKEMKDSLPKKSKQNVYDKIQNKMIYKFDSTGRALPSLETATLRIESKVGKDKAVSSPHPSTSKQMNEGPSRNITDIRNNEKILQKIKPEAVTDNVVITQHVVLVAPPLKNDYKLNKTEINSSIETISGSSSAHNRIIENEVTISTLNVESKNLHTPLKISSLLNPVYIPKGTSSDGQSARSLFFSQNQVVTKDDGISTSLSVQDTTPIKPLNVLPMAVTSESKPGSTSTATAVIIKGNTPKGIENETKSMKPEQQLGMLKDAAKEISKPKQTMSLGDSIFPIASTSTNTDKTKLVNSNMAKFTVDQHSRRRDLINQLEQSIAKGDERAAADAAVKLAQLRLSCSVLSYSSQIMAEASTAKSQPVNEIHKPSESNKHRLSNNKLNATFQSTSTESPNCVLRKTKLDLVNDSVQSKKISTPVHDEVSASKIINTERKGEDNKNVLSATPSTSKQTCNKNSSNVTTIQVMVEDREATRGPVPLQISRQAVMGDLRRQAETALGLDGALQRWIVGRVLCTDDQTPLISLAGLDFSAPFYLCVVETEGSDPVHNKIGENTKIKSSENSNSGKISDVYSELVKLEQRALVVNTEPFECGVCMVDCEAGKGAVLRECVHTFCRECMSDLVKHCEEPNVGCPAMGCPGILQEREIRGLVTPDEYERWLARGLAAAESGTKNAFHCRTRDCTGWALCEPGVRHFPCPVCKHRNCISCQAIHEGETCEQYQKKQASTSNFSQTDEGTRTLLDTLITKGEALECPECKAIITKKWGCDWVKCSACKTEICWVTRGRRWGPGGKGDTSGGCRCGVDGKRCHPSCGYCH